MMSFTQVQGQLTGLKKGGNSRAVCEDKMATVNEKVLAARSLSFRPGGDIPYRALDFIASCI